MDFLVVGRSYAPTLCMILVILQMRVPATKRKELCQTIVSLIASLRTETGCRCCDFYRNLVDENELCILEVWDTRKNLDDYLNSEGFRVLRGAMTLLQEPCEMSVHAVAAGERRSKEIGSALHANRLMFAMAGADGPSGRPN